MRLAATLAVAAMLAAAAIAQQPTPATTPAATEQQPAAPAKPDLLNTPANFAYIMDGDTGQELYSKNGHERMIPASMSKLMLYYVVFERLKEGRIKLTDEFTVSEHAWRTGGAMAGGSAARSNVSTMFLALNSKVSVENLLRGAIIISGNDACIVLAEGLFGSEATAASEMTKRAKEIGLENSTFENVTGLPGDNHRMTAADIAKLSYLIIKTFPEYYPMFSEPAFAWGGITQPNRNPLLKELPGSDGVKTGHLAASGYGLVGSSVEEGKRRIIVLNGLTSEGQRRSEGTRVMRTAFRDFRTVTMVTKGREVGFAEVWLGEQDRVPLLATEDLAMGLHADAARKIEAHIVYEGPLSAPVKQGDIVGKLVVSVEGREKPSEIPVAAGANVNKLNFFALAMRGLTGN
jgi:D-alanyl-D-alanine carboxypeptidase (penicillin-binding protein 5/6)